MLRSCLAGVRVVDLSQYLPGPYAGQLLADLGADVVKVEPPAGDPMRQLGPRDSDGVSPYYKLVNAGKTVVRLDLKSEAGCNFLVRLLGKTNILIESYRPGVLEQLGFSRTRLTEINPELVHVALSGYGQNGPQAQVAGHDINYMAIGGGLARSGTVERPVHAFPPTADFASGQVAALAALAGLHRRNHAGIGSSFDVAITDSVLAWQAFPLTMSLREPGESGREESLLGGGAACYRAYETADGRFVTLGALETKFWSNFCIAVERPDWRARQWEALPQKTLITEVAALFAMHSLSAWVERLGKIDCCFAPVVEPREVQDHPQIRARGLVNLVEGEDARVEVGFPAWLDVREPEARPAVCEVAPASLLSAWGI